MSETLTIDERAIEARTTQKLERIMRHKAFLEWLKKAVELRKGGIESAPPHELDDYELRRAVEAGLYGRV